MQNKIHVISIVKTLEENDEPEVIFNEIEKLCGEFLSKNGYLLCDQVEEIPESDL